MVDGALGGLLPTFCLDFRRFLSYITHPYIHHLFSLYQNINQYSRKILITRHILMHSDTTDLPSLDVKTCSCSRRTTCTHSGTRSHTNSPNRAPFPSNHVLIHVTGPSSRYTHEQKLSFAVPRPRCRDPHRNRPSVKKSSSHAESDVVQQVRELVSVRKGLAGHPYCLW